MPASTTIALAAKVIYTTIKAINSDIDFPIMDCSIDFNHFRAMGSEESGWTATEITALGCAATEIKALDCVAVYEVEASATSK